MNRSRRRWQLHARHGAAAALVFFVLASCGTASSGETAIAEPDTLAGPTEAAALDLTGVRLDVRRDPG